MENITVKKNTGKFGGFYSKEESIGYGQSFTHLVTTACSIRGGECGSVRGQVPAANKINTSFTERQARTITRVSGADITCCFCAKDLIAEEKKQN